MSAVGGDLATLAALHRCLGEGADRLTAVKRQLNSAVHNVVWMGANADRFRGEWESFAPTIDPRLTQALREAQADVRAQHNNLAAATGESAFL